VAFAVGVFTPFAAIGCALVGTLVFLQYPLEQHATLQLLYQGAFLCGCTDVALRWTPFPQRPKAIASSLRTWRWFAVSIHLWAATAKLGGTWLDGTTLRWLGTSGSLTPDVARLLVTSQATAEAVAWAVVGLELAIPVLLLISRTRWLGLGLGLGFHLLMEWSTRFELLGVGILVLLVAFIPRDETGPGAVQHRPRHS
jgi:hypothetical protein